MRPRALFPSILVIFFVALPLFPQSATINTCGTVTAFVPASTLTAGLLTISGQTFTIAANTTLQNQALVTAGANVCLTATLDIAGQITTPATVTANVTTHLDLCGTVSAYTAAMEASNGSMTLAGRTIPIAAGTSITNSDLIRAGADLCLSATVNALGQIVAPSSVSANVTSTLSLCGTVSAFTAATSMSNGSLTIAGRTITIAAGTTITNSDLIRAGADLCLNATLNASGEIIVPSSVTAHAAAHVTICGTVNAFVGASSSSPGSITIDGRTFRITAGTSIGNSDAIRVGVSICLDATLDVNGDIIPPTSAQPNQPPTLSVPGPQYVAPHQTLTFRVTASDSDGDNVTLSASNVPPNASFDASSGTFTMTPSDDQVGMTFTVTFTATDSRGAQTSRNVDVHVVVSNENGPPILSVPPSPRFITVDKIDHFIVTATPQAPNCNVTLGASDLPPGATFDPATGTFTFAPIASQIGMTFRISFSATDCANRRSVAIVDEIVLGPNGPLTSNPNLCVPVSEIVFTNGCASVRVPVTNDSDGNVSVDEIALSDGTHFRIAGAPSAAIVLPPHATIDLDVSFDGETTVAAADRIVIRSGASTTEISLRNDMRRRATAH